MAARGDEIIRLRNEGAAAYDKMIKEHGYEAARQMLMNRLGVKCSVVIRPDEVNYSVKALQTAVTNTYLALIYTTLHDVCGYGKKRLHRFKKAFDELTAVCYAVDRHGRRYVTVADCAEDLNRLYGMGLDVDVIRDTEASSSPMQSRLVDVDEMIRTLKEKGFKDASDMVWRDVYGPEKATSRAQTKEQRAIAKQRRREDRKYIPPNMNLFDPDVSAGYLAVLCRALDERGMDMDEISAVCGEVNTTLQGILEGGKAVYDALLADLEEKTGIVFE